MSRAKPYTVAGRTFPTQAALEAEVAHRKARQPCNVEFPDDFLAAVVNTLHEEVRASGQRATGRFELLDAAAVAGRGLPALAGVPLLLAEFAPSGRWQPVSVTPWRRRRTIAYRRGCIKEALLTLAEAYRPELPLRTGVCSERWCYAGDEDLCPSPAFWERTAEECLEMMTREEVETRFGYNRYDPARDDLVKLLPAAHPAVRYLLTRDLGWAWRCAEHRRPAVDDLKIGAR